MGQHLAIINACCEVASDDEENAKLEEECVERCTSPEGTINEVLQECAEKCTTPEAIINEVLQIYKKLSDFDGKWMNDQGQKFEIRNGMILANIGGTKIQQKMIADEERGVFILEESNEGPNLWSMPINGEPVWSDGSKSVKWNRAEMPESLDSESGGSYIPIEGVSDFDGKWKNDYGQEFEVKDGIISMEHMGEIVKDAINFDHKKQTFELVGDPSWKMPLKGDTLWSDGVWSVRWTRVEEVRSSDGDSKTSEDSSQTLTKFRTPSRRSVHVQAKQKEPPFVNSEKPEPGNRVDYFLECERDPNANKFSQFVDDDESELHNNPNVNTVEEYVKYSELQRRCSSSTLIK